LLLSGFFEAKLGQGVCADLGLKKSSGFADNFDVCSE
jgi:hypothetical protein